MISVSQLCPNIIVADDHPILRSGICFILKSHFPVVRIREAEDGDQAIALCKQSPADIMIMDLNMPNTDPQKMVYTLLALQPAINILVFTMYKEEIYGPLYYKIGARGFIPKMNGEKELVKAVETVLAGKIYIRDEMRDFYQKRDGTIDPYALLSNKEKEVLRHLVTGDSQVNICKKLNIGITTVSTHKGNILRKLKLNNLMELKAMVDNLPLE